MKTLEWLFGFIASMFRKNRNKLLPTPTSTLSMEERMRDKLLSARQEIATPSAFTLKIIEDIMVNVIPKKYASPAHNGDIFISNESSEKLTITIAQWKAAIPFIIKKIHSLNIKTRSAADDFWIEMESLDAYIDAENAQPTMNTLGLYR